MSTSAWVLTFSWKPPAGPFPPHSQFAGGENQARDVKSQFLKVTTELAGAQSQTLNLQLLPSKPSPFVHLEMPWWVLGNEGRPFWGNQAQMPSPQLREVAGRHRTCFPTEGFQSAASTPTGTGVRLGGRRGQAT